MAAAAAVSATLALLAAFLMIPLFFPHAAPSANAAPGSVDVRVDRALSVIDEAVVVSIAGDVASPLEGADLVVSVRGPVALSEIGKGGADAPEVARVVTPLGVTPTPSTGAGGTAPEADTTDTSEAPTTTTTEDYLTVGAGTDLTAGVVAADVTLPAGTPAAPGAYLVTVEVGSGEAHASGQIWLGKAVRRDAPLDVAFVFSVATGIHWDPTGAFFDRALEQATTSDDSGPGSLREFPAVFGRFPDWRFTLAVEPVLLTQLRDMSDGYTGVDASGAQVEVGADAPSSLDAAAALSDMRSLAALERVQTVVSPYAGADLSILATEGWRDGLEQVLLGKQELQQSLGLSSTLIGACSPDLDFASSSLPYYAAASIDHVIVDSTLATSLVEPVAHGTVAVRARDKGNDRITLVLADTALGDFMAEQWDEELFPAALAAGLAALPRDALVIAPGNGFEIVPASYLAAVGEVLSGQGWIRTQTVAEIIRAHSPGARPVLLDTEQSAAQGYIEETLWAGIRSAHAAVVDLAEVADATKSPVETAHRLLFLAESRWWSRPDVSPQEASIGLAYATGAQTVAQGELSKVRFVGADSARIYGGEGVVRIIAENTAEYPVRVGLRLTGDGVTFPDGGDTQVELQPGQTILPVRVARTEGTHTVRAQLVAGSTVLGELSQPIRFFGLEMWLPWVIVAALAIGAGTYVLIRRWLRRRRAA